MSSEITNPISVLIVDDEPVAVRGLCQLLRSRLDIQVIGTARNGPEAVKLIGSLKPQVVLLDIEMPGMNGFEVVAQIGKYNIPHLVFVTAHQEFALQAFDVHALDYVLKPVDEDRLFSTLDRVRAYSDQDSRNQSRRIDSLITTVSAGEHATLEPPTQLVFKSRGAVVRISIDHISRIESAGNYVRYFVASECYLARATMNQIATQLASTSLLRVHRSRIVNVKRIYQIKSQPQGEYIITLDDGVEVSTGKSYREQIRQLMQQGLKRKG